MGKEANVAKVTAYNVKIQDLATDKFVVSGNEFQAVSYGRKM
jgi:hypothetical protein